MEDSSRGIDQEPTPNNTVKEQIYWSFQSSIPAFPAYYHSQLSHDNDNSKSREIGTKYLGTGRFTGGEVSPIEWSVTCDPYPQLWRSLLNNVKVPVCIDTAAPRSYMTEDFYELHPFLINHTKCKADIDQLKMANGACLSVKFMIPLVISFEGHMFEIITLVSESKGEALLVFGMKSIVEMEGTLCSKTMLNM